MAFLKNVMVFLKKAVLLLITVITLLTTGLYIQCNIYNFQKESPFAGSSLYNPYAGDTGTVWSKTNFHAHSVAWNHLTNGHQSPGKVIDAYTRLGYDIACLSNYHNVTEVVNAGIKNIAVYEHGYNIFKTHQLVFEPSRVSFFDIPFFQTASMKQSVMDALADESSCIAITHPVIRNGYSDEDLKKISGYSFIEVLNHSANSAAKWDVILSAGKPVWCLGNDDMHNAEKESEVGVCWTMINAVNSNKDITEQLKKGNAYIVQGKNGIAGNALKSLLVTGDTLHLVLANIANTIQFIGQNGIPKQINRNANTATYIFKPEDTYIRAEVINDSSTLYLNPVIRYDGLQLPANYSTATINVPATILYRFLVSLLCVSILLLLYGKSLIRMSEAFKRARYKKSPGYSFGAT